MARTLAVLLAVALALVLVDDLMVRGTLARERARSAACPREPGETYREVELLEARVHRAERRIAFWQGWTRRPSFTGAALPAVHHQRPKSLPNPRSTIPFRGKPPAT
jgi:hypothetical protein